MQKKPRQMQTPVTRPTQIEIELLEDEMDEDYFLYSHGLSENVDHFQSKHSPYDKENDGQDFYYRLMNNHDQSRYQHDNTL